MVNSDWDAPLRWDRAAATAGERRRVFPSLCDPFEDRPDLDRPRGFFLGLIRRTPHLDWLTLTKRPRNIKKLIDRAHVDIDTFAWARRWLDGDPPANLWIGVSVEDQARADERIPTLLKIPAALRWLSVEPLLEPVDLTPWLGSGGIGWVVVGGESGKGARPCDLAWVRSIRDQCKAAGVPVFVKQLGSRPMAGDVPILGATSPIRLRNPKGGNPAEWPADLGVREFPR